MIRPLVCSLIVLGLAGLSPVEASVLKRWPDGPVRYIAEKQEIKVFKKLSTDEERALFIERFWTRRDPSRGTLTNEYRQMFWERVHESNSLFTDGGGPGWRTDRGKIYILYGPPTKIEDMPNLETSTGPTSGHGLIRWLYEGRPGGRTDGSPVVIVPFTRMATGEYRVSYDPELASVFFDELAVREKWNRDANGFIETFGSPRASELSVMLDLGRMQEVPPHAQVLLERVETVESYRTHPLEVGLTRYRHPEREGVLAVVTTDVSHIPDDVNPAVVARFRPLDATQEQRMLGEDSFKIDTSSGRRLAQGRLVLPSGDYDLTVLVANPENAATGMFRNTFRAMGPTEQLRMSDVSWAHAIDPIEYVSLSSYDEAYQVGPFHVVPKLDKSYRLGETINLFYEVYGGAAPYRVSYQIEGQDLDGSWVPLGQPSISAQQGRAQGWGVPTSTRWPTGEYRVRIEIIDAGERLVVSQVPFTLVADEGS